MKRRTQLEQSGVQEQNSWREIAISAIAKHQLRTYPSTVTFEPKDFDLRTRRWLWPPLEELARRSAARPLSRANVDLLRDAIDLALKLPDWHSMVARPVAAVTLEDVTRCFGSLDDNLLSNQQLSPYTRYHLSRAFRSFIGKVVRAGSSDHRFERLHVLWKSQLAKFPRSSRALISDLAWPSRPPASAIPHSSFEELKQRTRDTLDTDLQRINAASLDVVRRYNLALSELDRLCAEKIPKARESEVRRLVSSANDRRWSEAEIAQILPVAVRLMRSARHQTIAGSQQLYLPLRAALHQVGNGPTLRHLVLLREAPPAQLLVACALVLQIHTGWNIVSVLELKLADVSITNFPHQLQSVKPKTGDRTPVAFVERGDTDVIAVCNLLRDRVHALIAANLACADEERIWLGAFSIVGGAPESLASWAPPLARLQEKYALPRFSFEQIRTQVLGLASLGAAGILDARRVAGHLLPSTTRGYIDQVLLRRLNAANLYEFERRLDATVRYMIDPSQPLTHGQLIPYPLGDGASCIDPTAPPIEDWLDAAMCSAQYCHANGGCPKRTLLVTRDRIEEVIRTKCFYEANWEQLLDENPTKFERVHANNMIFNFAFYGVLIRGPYRNVVRQCEKGLQEDAPR